MLKDVKSAAEEVLGNIEQNHEITCVQHLDRTAGDTAKRLEKSYADIQDANECN